MPIHRIPPKETLKQLGQILERSQDSLCWGLVEDLGLSYFDLKYHQVEESLNIIQSAQDQSLAHRIRLTTAAAWVDGPDVLRSIFRTLAAAIAAGNEEVWIGLPEQSHHTAQLLQLLLHPLDLGIRIVPSDVEPFIESCPGQVHTLLIHNLADVGVAGCVRWGMRVHFEGPANDAIRLRRRSRNQRTMGSPGSIEKLRSRFQCSPSNLRISSHTGRIYQCPHEPSTKFRSKSTRPQ